MVKKTVNKLLNEIFNINSINQEKLKKDFDLQFRHSSKGKNEDKYNRILKYTFKTKKYKYIVDIEEYDFGFNLISFYPKLNVDFELRQLELSKQHKPYYTKYSYQTKENIPLQIFNLLMVIMKDLLKENPNLSFGFFGSPNINTDDDSDFFNTKRMRIYLEMIKRNFQHTHKFTVKYEYSGGLILNNEVLTENPSLVNYSQSILKSHL